MTVLSCPSLFTVNDLGDMPDANPGDTVCADANGKCTLRAAIQEANAITPCSPLTINFSVTGTINLATALPDLNHPNLTINGPGANQLDVHRNAVTPFRIFTINSGKTVGLNGLTISNGDAGTGAWGGGIISSGILSINNCEIRGNHADNGGGLSIIGGQVTISDSTVSGNTTTFQGAGIDDIAGADLTLINTTISGNTAGTTPGGIRIIGGGTLTLVNCTVTNNTSLTNFTGGVGTNTSSVTRLRNTIVANNVGADLRNSGGTVTSLGNNLTSDNGGGFLTAAGDLINTNPLLATLGNYGGPTQTHRPLPGSSAINAGNNCVLTANGCGDNNPALTTDQRGAGFNRQVGGTVDIGAVEVNYALAATSGMPQSTTVNTAFTNPLVATLTESGNPVSGVLLTFTAPGSGPSATFPGGNTATTNASGQASVNVAANTISGSAYTVTANTTPGLATPASFRLIFRLDRGQFSRSILGVSPCSPCRR